MWRSEHAQTARGIYWTRPAIAPEYPARRMKVTFAHYICTARLFAQRLSNFVINCVKQYACKARTADSML